MYSPKGFNVYGFISPSPQSEQLQHSETFCHASSLVVKRASHPNLWKTAIYSPFLWICLLQGIR